MRKRFINVVDCVFVGGVFEGRWIGLDEVKAEKIFQKAILPDINKFITSKFCTFFYKGNEYTSRVSKRPLWVFE